MGNIFLDCVDLMLNEEDDIVSANGSDTLIKHGKRQPNTADTNYPEGLDGSAVSVDTAIASLWSDIYGGILNHFKTSNSCVEKGS